MRLFLVGCLVVAGCVTEKNGDILGWDFLDLEGKVHSGEIRLPRGHAPVIEQDVALERVPPDKRTGVMFVWRDRSKARPFIICEYINGIQHGFDCEFWFSKSGWSGHIGSLDDGNRSSAVFFREGRGIFEAEMYLDKMKRIRRYIYLPELGEETLGCLNFQYPKDGSPYITTYTNELQDVKRE
jgi:hypothetical protein